MNKRSNHIQNTHIGANMTTIAERIEAQRAKLAELEAAQQKQRDEAALTVGRALIDHLGDEEAFVAAAREHVQRHAAAQEREAQRKAAANERAAKSKRRKAAEAVQRDSGEHHG